MFIWGRLTSAGAGAEALLGPAIAAGVAFVPGAAFGVGSGLTRHLRLSFATATADRLDVAAERLGRALSASEASFAAS